MRTANWCVIPTCLITHARYDASRQLACEYAHLPAALQSPWGVVVRPVTDDTSLLL
jgi:hypothetical protein